MNQFYLFFLISTCVLLSCRPNPDFTPSYYQLIRNAEIQIVKNNFHEALNLYQKAFQKHHVPFGKDIFNAAIVAFESNQHSEGEAYCKYIIDRSQNPIKLYESIVPKYVSDSIWSDWIKSKDHLYDISLIDQLNEITFNDQLFRPLYEVYDDTINQIRKINLKEIIQLSRKNGMPAQMELGYSDRLKGFPYHVVLHHTAQRRSTDTTVMNLEPMLRKAVNSGRIDPEQAIYYLNFQYGSYDKSYMVYSTKQVVHKSFPDSILRKIIYPNIDQPSKLKADSIRAIWHADTLAEIEEKVKYLNKTSLPFIFTSVRHSKILLDESLSPDEAYEQYLLFSNFSNIF